MGLADCALEGYQSSPNLPVDILPLNLLCVVHVLDKAVKIKETVCHMLCDDLSVEVNKDLGIGTHHPLILLTRIKLTAINASRKQGRPLVLAITRINIG